MKRTTWVFLTLLACLAASIFAQTDKQSVVTPIVRRLPNSTIIGSAVIQGIQVSVEGAIVRCQGACEITDHAVLLTADQLDYHKDTGQTIASGNVRMKFLNVEAKPD